MTKTVIYGSIATVWVLAALISFLPISLHLHKPEQFDKSNITKQIINVTNLGENYDLVSNQAQNQCALDLTPTYAIVSSCISFIFPCIVMLAIYSRLFFYAKMHVQNIKAMTKPVTLGRFEGNLDQPTSNEQASRRNSPNYHVSDHKAAITLGIIMGVFLICWVPFFCVNIIAAFCKTCIPPIVFKILTWLGYSNSAFNPIIYSIFNLEFREAFQRILASRCSQICFRQSDIYDDIHTPRQSHIQMDHLRSSSNIPNISRSNSRRHSSEISPSLQRNLVLQEAGHHLLVVEKIA